MFEYFGRSTFGAIDGLDAFCPAAEAINNAADGTSLALYAGHRAEPLCDDVPGRAIQLTMLLREYRGSAHLAAIRSLGLNVAVAHAIKRPDDVTMFGYTEAPVISDEDRAKHKAAETLTDEMVLGAFSAVDAEGAEALMAGLVAMEAAVDG